MPGKGRIAKGAINYAVKYGPLVYEAVKHGREPAQRALQNAWTRQGNRRQALRHAGTVIDGSVLRVFHGGEQVWVVFAGENPIASYPSVDKPLPAVLEHADLSLRIRPGEPSPRRLPDVPDAVRKAPGAVRKAPGAVRKAPDAVRKAPSVVRKALGRRAS